MRYKDQHVSCSMTTKPTDQALQIQVLIDQSAFHFTQCVSPKFSLLPWSLVPPHMICQTT